MYFSCNVMYTHYVWLTIISLQRFFTSTVLGQFLSVSLSFSFLFIFEYSPSGHCKIEFYYKIHKCLLIDFFKWSVFAQVRQVKESTNTCPETDERIATNFFRRWYDFSLNSSKVIYENERITLISVHQCFVRCI